ncbi:MAG TPA: sigma-54 dependent transcriptional regulator [Candidatus Limnocylindrales bacterium]|nr:sigma-54 dependent transcriptional regulator [Candidatus Limnocylindrales bacterium]
MGQTKKILVISDDPQTLHLASKALQKPGCKVIFAEKGPLALDLIEQNLFEAIIVDLKMPDVDGFEILKIAKLRSSNTPLITVVEPEDVKLAVKAMQKGAYGYLIKPINFYELQVLIKRALDQQQMLTEVVELRKRLDKKYAFENIVRNSEAMQRICDTIARISLTRSTILIQGESGTGKELIARAIHHNSAHRDKPFIALNCGAIPEGIIESELFGHERGAFTGAWSVRKGMFELANGGTLFLDEIGEMSLSTQVKLLRVLEQKEFMRVGGAKTIRVDVNIIAATNTNLEEAVRQKTFREDLYYRLKVITLYLPPLRERREDIPLLVQKFIEEFNQENNRSVRGIEPKALTLLQNYHWPGNVRELKNCIESLVVTSRGEYIRVEDLPPYILKAIHPEPEMSFKIGTPLDEIEKEVIQKTLAYVNGNKTRAAKLLKIGLRTLHRKIKKYQ